MSRKVTEADIDVAWWKQRYSSLGKKPRGKGRWVFYFIVPVHSRVYKVYTDTYPNAVRHFLNEANTHELATSYCGFESFTPTDKASKE